MKSPIVRITSFIIITALFVSGLIAYSHSRGKPVSENTSTEESWNNSDNNRRFEKVFRVSEDGLVKVEADAGTVRIDSWDKPEVSIVVEVDGSDSRVEKYNVEFMQDGNTVSVIGKIRDKSFFKWNMGNIEARYTIYIPKKFNSSIETSGGNITATNLTGSMKYETSGGDIIVEKSSGVTNVNTSGGDIELTDIVGNVKAETSGGNVRCENVQGSVDGQTSGGNVELRSVDGEIKAGTSGGGIIIKVTGDNKGIFAETSGGDIDIYVKEGTAADLDAETTGGSVDCDLPVVVRGKVRDSELHGKINGGGNPIKAETSGGSIKIAILK